MRLLGYASAHRLPLLILACCVTWLASTGSALAARDLTISTAPSANISSASIGGVTFVGANAANANLELDTLNGMLSLGPVVVTTAVGSGSDPGIVTIAPALTITGTNGLEIVADDRIETDGLDVGVVLTLAAPDVRFNDDITGSGSVEVDGALDISTSVSVDIGGDFTTSGAIAGDGFDIDASRWILGGAVTSTSVVRALGVVELGADVTAPVVSFEDDVTLTAPVRIDTTTSASFERVDGAHALTVDTDPSGNVSIGSDMGSITPVASLAIPDGYVFVGGGSHVTTSGAQVYGGTLDAAGFLRLTASDLDANVITPSDGLEVAVSGVANVTGSINGTFVKSGSGLLVVSGSPFSTFDVTGGEVRVLGTYGAATLAAGARVSGTGQVATVAGAGAVAPGNPASAIGALRTVRLTGARVEIDLTSSTADSITLLDSGGTGSIGAGTTIAFSAASLPAVGASYTIVDHEGTDETTAFANLAEGARVTIGGAVFAATYRGGDGNDLVITRIVAPTTTTLAQSAAASTEGGPVSFTASVSSTGAPLTGSVEFRDGGTLLGSAPLASGSATLTTSKLAVGAHSIAATFVPTTAEFAGSTSSALAHAVEAAPRPVTVDPLLAITTPTLSSACVRPRTKDIVARYALQRAAKVTYTLQRRANVPRVRSCPTRPTKSAPNTRLTYRRVTAKARALGAGKQALRLSQLVRVRSLQPGVYRLLIAGTATDGTKLKAKTVAFIVAAR